MNFQDGLNKMRNIQQNILDYIENETDDQENYQKIKTLIDENKLKNDIKTILHLIVNISNNHHRNNNFFNKIEQILHFFHEKIKIFSNSEIFNIFKSSKRILLFLINEKLLTIDKNIALIMSKGKYGEEKYPEYFSPEILPILKEIKNPNESIEEKCDRRLLISKLSDEMPENFEELRKIGENENYICKLIREDLVEEFIAYVNKSSIKLNSIICMSIFETNKFLLKKMRFTFIEYAAFFGSIQIFQYLQFNKVELKPSLWFYAIHGQNADMIHLLEENKVELPISISSKNEYECLIIEAIKCNHNNIANYFIELSLQTEFDNVQSQAIKYFNFNFIKDDMINQSFLFEFIQYDYYDIVSFLMQKEDLDVNKIKI